MAFVKREKYLTGGTLYRGGLMSKTALDEVRESLAAGQEAEVLLRGVTSCSRFEAVAVEFARRATPTRTMVRVMFSVSLEHVEYTAAIAQQAGLPYGPAVSIELISKFPEEKEVILLGGTVLKVRPGELIEVGNYDFECVHIKATVDWDELRAYFALCDRARPARRITAGQRHR
jgi:hypothetical protein